MTSKEKLFSNFDIKRKVHEFIYLQYERFLVEHLNSKRNEKIFFSFEVFLENLENTKWKEIMMTYPVLEHYIPLQKKNLNKQFLNILNSFEQDAVLLKENGIIKRDSLEDVHIGIGDFHNGNSTAIVELKDNEKVVYKPKNGRITKAYNIFLDWINRNKPLGDYKYEILEKGDYHWLQFINYKECRSKNELQSYYIRAGGLLCVSYLLNASDFHYENIIANGATPILIDHETVIQPKIDKTQNNLFKNYGAEDQEDTVLQSFLLPNFMKGNSLPRGMSGFGYHKQIEIQSLQKVGVNRFTKDWKILVDFVNTPLYKQNIPIFKGKRVFTNEYLKDLVEGFESYYRLFMDKRNLLLSNKSPLKEFNNCKIRLIWRSTSVYGNIQNKMKLPKNLKNEEIQEQVIRNYLSIAFKNVPKDSYLWWIYEHEVAQLMRGDIPYFEVNSSSRDLETDFGTIKNFFEFNAVENIERKINKLSEDDLVYQKQLIRDSILG